MDLGMDESMVAKNPVRNMVLGTVGSLRTSSQARYTDLGTTRDLITSIRSTDLGMAVGQKTGSLVPNKVQICAFLHVQILFGQCWDVQILQISNYANDVVGLLAFKSTSVVSDPGGFLNNWSLDNPRPCSWRGVFCSSGGGRMVALDLANAGLSGPPLLLGCHRLASLNLSRNFIPSGSLDVGPSLLQHVLSRNRSYGSAFSGWFPLTLSLFSLNLGTNSLSIDFLTDSSGTISGGLKREVGVPSSGTSTLKQVQMSWCFLCQTCLPPLDAFIFT